MHERSDASLADKLGKDFFIKKGIDVDERGLPVIEMQGVDGDTFKQSLGETAVLSKGDETMFVFPRVALSISWATIGKDGRLTLRNDTISNKKEVTGEIFHASELALTAQRDRLGIEDKPL